MKSESRKLTKGDYLQLPKDSKVRVIAFQPSIPTPTVQREMKCILIRGMLQLYVTAMRQLGLS